MQAPGPAYTNTQPLAAPLRVVPVHLDSAFTLYERAKIFRAISEWNHALNGYVRLEAVGDAIRPGGWTVTKVDSRHPAVASPTMKRALAVTVSLRSGALANAIVYVVADRIGTRHLGGILLHEFGHALGAGHDAGSQLMHPYYTGDKQRCIDKGAVRAIAAAQSLPLESLNWCAGARGEI